MASKARKQLEQWQKEDADRLLAFWEAAKAANPKLSQRQFAEDHQIGDGSQGILWQYIRGVIPLNVDAAIRFAKGFGCKVSDFSPRLEAERQRLAAGDGQLPDQLAEITAGGFSPILAWEHPDDLPPGEYVDVPRLKMVLGAGPGREQQLKISFVKEQAQAFRADWIRKRGLRPSKLAVMKVSGDSMEPRIHDGDAVVIDTSQIEIVDGAVYALWYDDGERVKRLYRRPGGGIIIHSDHETKHPQMILAGKEANNIRIIGRVVHVSGDGGL